MITNEEIDEARKLAKKFPDIDTGNYLCHVPRYQNRDFFGDDRWVEEYWGFFDKEQMGYKRSDEKIVYFTRMNLLDALQLSDSSRDVLVKEVLKK